MLRFALLPLAAACLLLPLAGCRSNDGPEVPATPEARAERVAALERSRDETRAQLIALIEQPAPGTLAEQDPRHGMDPELRRLAEALFRIERDLAAIGAEEAPERESDAPFVIKRR